MSEKPILFSAPMIRALLAGTKTQTRRLLTLPEGLPCNDLAETDPEFFGHLPITSAERWGYSYGDDGGPLSIANMAPHAPGDRLWVRENVACGACAPSKPSHWSPAFWRREQGSPVNPNGLWYQADGLSPERTITDRGPWTPSIHMPRWASRLTLIVTNVRVQRLQEITSADAIAEGCAPYANSATIDCDTPDPRDDFRALWNSINGDDAWERNDWVAVYTFTAHRCNVDAITTEPRP